MLPCSAEGCLGTTHNFFAPQFPHQQNGGKNVIYSGELREGTECKRQVPSALAPDLAVSSPELSLVALCVRSCDVKESQSTRCW